MQKQYKKELTYASKSNEEVFSDFLKLISGEKTSENSFIFNSEKWFVDYHPFSHSDDIIVKEEDAERFDKFLLIKHGAEKTRIVGWCDKKILTSIPARDIYRNGTSCYVVMSDNLQDLSSFNIEDNSLELKKEFLINAQEADNYGHAEMISGVLAGLHYFAKKSEIYFKDLNAKDEAILGEKRIKIYTRDYLSDEDMLISENYYQSHKDVDLYILCKIKAGKYNYLGYVEKEEVDRTRVVQMTGNVDMDGTGEQIRRIFSDQYKNLSDFIKIFEEAKKEEKIIVKQNYVPLHVHSEWSVGDGFGKTSYIAKTLREKGFSACALTDHGTLAGVWEFQKACLLENIKPIIG
jgi:DNA polymerase III alpha subunit (gram-positive type)